MSLEIVIEGFRDSVRQVPITGVDTIDPAPSGPIAPTDQLLAALAKLQAQIDAIDVGGGGGPAVNYEIVAGVIRRVAGGAGSWQFIEDASHTQMHLASITESGDEVQVLFDKTYGKVISCIAVADETYTLSGITFGTSILLDRVRILAYSSLSSGRILSAASFSLSTLGGGISSPTWNATFNCCRVTISNTFTRLNAWAIAPISRNAKYRCIIRETGNNYVDVQFVDKDGVIATAYDAGNMAFDLTVNRPRQININDQLNNPGSSNIWIMGIMQLAP